MYCCFFIFLFIRNFSYATLYCPLLFQFNTKLFIFLNTILFIILVFCFNTKLFVSQYYFVHVLLTTISSLLFFYFFFIYIITVYHQLQSVTCSLYIFSISRARKHVHVIIRSRGLLCSAGHWRSCCKIHLILRYSIKLCCWFLFLFFTYALVFVVICFSHLDSYLGVLYICMYICM